MQANVDVVVTGNTGEMQSVTTDDEANRWP